VTQSLARWLSVREAADTRSRSAAVTMAVVSQLPSARPLRILDLATGTGANIRYLSSRLPEPQRWRAVDRDPGLLAYVPSHVDARCAELGSLDDATMFSEQHLVTASALLDLVSERWLASLARSCRQSGAAVLFALSYDGRFSCSPQEPEDELVRELFNTHQRNNDKGFGRAAGPDAAAAMIAALQDAGYEVLHESTDWELTHDEEAMQRELIAGWVEAAVEVEPRHGRVIRNWLARRLAHVDEGRSRLQVGHQDIAGWIK
jgi:trans-aconitate methyltransferase